MVGKSQENVRTETVDAKTVDSGNGTFSRRSCGGPKPDHFLGEGLNRVGSNGAPKRVNPCGLGSNTVGLAFCAVFRVAGVALPACFGSVPVPTG